MKRGILALITAMLLLTFLSGCGSSETVSTTYAPSMSQEGGLLFYRQVLDWDGYTSAGIHTRSLHLPDINGLEPYLVCIDDHMDAYIQYGSMEARQSSLVNDKFITPPPEPSRTLGIYSLTDQTYRQVAEAPPGKYPFLRAVSEEYIFWSETRIQRMQDNPAADLACLQHVVVRETGEDITFALPESMFIFDTLTDGVRTHNVNSQNQTPSDTLIDGDRIYYILSITKGKTNMQTLVCFDIGKRVTTVLFEDDGYPLELFLDDGKVALTTTEDNHGRQEYLLDENDRFVRNAEIGPSADEYCLDGWTGSSHSPWYDGWMMMCFDWFKEGGPTPGLSGSDGKISGYGMFRDDAVEPVILGDEDQVTISCDVQNGFAFFDIYLDNQGAAGPDTLQRMMYDIERSVLIRPTALPNEASLPSEYNETIGRPGSDSLRFYTTSKRNPDNSADFTICWIDLKEIGQK